MKTKIMLIIALAAGSAGASILPMQSEYYYQLGGASDVYIPPVNRDQTITLGGNINTGGLNCNLFNPVVSITNTLNDLKTSSQGIPAAVVDNLKGSIGGFPMYKLQQSMPGLYNILQNGSLGAQNAFALRVQDCHDVKRSLVAGQSPIESMLSVSDSQGWIDAALRTKNGEQVDVISDAKIIAKHSDEYGIPWVHRSEGNSGGKLQKPINVISDVVIAGYNVMLTPTRDLDETSAPVNDTSNGFVRIWSTPVKAAKWAVMVLGDIEVSTKPDAKKIEAGVGLSALLHSCPKIASSSTCVTNIARFLWDLIEKKESLNEKNLAKISAANILITEDIITAIQRMPREQQILSVSKLSEEIAIQNLLEEAMSLRRILQAGMQIQEVQHLKPALVMVKYAISKLDKDREALAFESKVRKKLMTETLSLIMSLRTNGLVTSMPGDDHEQALVKNGAVYRNNTDKDN